jgi:hypothetical protein
LTFNKYNDIKYEEVLFFEEVCGHFDKFIGGKIMGFREILQPWIWSPEGAYGEGNSQWFFTISIAILTTILWSIAPEIALTFTILWAVHLFSIYVFGNFVEDSIGASIFLILTNVALIIIGLLNNVTFTLLSMAASAYMYRIGEIISARDNRDYDMTFSLSCLLFVALILVTCGAPFVWWLKLIIILGLAALHPVIDYANMNCLMTGMALYAAGEKICESTRRLLGKEL